MMKIKSTEGDDIEDDHLVGIDDGAQPMRHNHASSIATNLSQASNVLIIDKNESHELYAEMLKFYAVM